jgi:GT2 family glycosyltransferase
MTIHVKTPYAEDKNLGRAYNKAFEDVEARDWVCLIDHDVMFLTPDAIGLMYEYARSFPETGIFTCYTNRIHPLAADQLLDGRVNENTCIKYHSERAYNQKRFGISITQIDHVISGFLMLVSKQTWNRVKFPEHGKCLGVDNLFSQAVMNEGRKIYRMNSLYVWHSYRLMNGITNKEHLK